MLIAGMMLATSVLVAVAPSASARLCQYFDFAKNSSNQLNSDLTWVRPDNQGHCGDRTNTWRAGSGLTTDGCQTNYGWLPNGWYDMTSTGMTDGYSGSLIHRRVWSLQDKSCAGDGTIRTELFIHTEETVGNGQTCSSSSDDQWCWDDTRSDPGASLGTNDYKSEGCIKVRRQSLEGNWADNMTDVHSTYHLDVGGHHNSLIDMVYVHN
jgi:hypothetical protein